MGDQTPEPDADRTSETRDGDGLRPPGPVRASERGNVEATNGTDATVLSAGESAVDRLDPVVPQAGQTLGRYVVLTRLGAGAMGVVLAAYDPELDRRVAVKLLHDGGRGYERLQREAQALARLSHPNVVAVHDVGVHEGRVFVAMEYVEGSTLGAAIGSGKPWRGVLEVFEAAGRGLAAAHRQGLIHRDFKPDNVMVGDDGRVRVMDFGLARTGNEAVASAATASTPRLNDEASALDTPLTQTGALMGTPAYMSPEQFAGVEVTERSDQFSYCVALYEALYGRRPFEGRTLGELAMAVTEGVVEEPKVGGVGGTTIPRWLFAIVRRGLDVDPGRRFADMGALLEALGRAEARRRTRRIVGFVGLGVGVIAAGIGAQAWERGTRVDACRDHAAALDLRWNDGVRTKIAEAMSATGVTYADTAAQKITPWVDRRITEWSDATQTICEARTVDRTMSEADHAKASWCLDDRRLAIEALIDELSTDPDAVSVRNAVQAAASMASATSCVDARSLATFPDPPAPDQRAAVTDVRKQLAKAGTLLAVGRYADGLVAAQAASATAAELGWVPLAAAAKESEAMLHWRAGDAERAETLASRAYFDAAAVGAWQVAQAAATLVSFVLGHDAERHDEATVWSRHSDVAIDHAGIPLGLRQASRANNLAVATGMRGQHDEALAALAPALEARVAALGPDHPEVADTVNNIGIVREMKGEFEVAIEHYQRARGIYERALGDQHPSVANAWNNLGAVHWAKQDFAAARDALKHALEIRERSLGAEHPEVALTLNNLGILLESMELGAEADVALARAVEIREVVYGNDHLAVAETLSIRGSLKGSPLPYEEGREQLLRAQAIREAKLGTDHPGVAEVLHNLGSLQLRHERFGEAKITLQRALDMKLAKLPAEHPSIAEVRANLALAEAG